MELRVLAVGDVVGEGGLQCLEQHLRSLKKLYRIDFCVVNGENASGTGLTPKQADRMLDAFNRERVAPAYQEAFGEFLKLKDLDISADDIKNIFSKDEYLDHFSEMSEDYIVVAYEEEYDMSGQFYVDEKYLYLLDNTLKKYNGGIIYRIDEAGELVTLQYVVEREGNKNRILTWITKDGALW